VRHVFDFLAYIAPLAFVWALLFVAAVFPEFGRVLDALFGLGAVAWMVCLLLILIVGIAFRARHQFPR